MVGKTKIVTIYEQIKSSEFIPLFVCIKCLNKNNFHPKCHHKYPSFINHIMFTLIPASGISGTVICLLLYVYLFIIGKVLHLAQPSLFTLNVLGGGC